MPVNLREKSDYPLFSPGTEGHFPNLKAILGKPFLLEITPLFSVQGKTGICYDLSCLLVTRKSQTFKDKMGESAECI